MKKRILLIHRSLGLGGAEKVFAFVANSLSEKYETEILLLSRSSRTLDINDQTPVIVRECYSNLPIVGKNMIKGICGLHGMSKAILEEIKAFSADLVICFDLRIILAVWLIKRKINAKILFSERADPYENPKYWAIILENIYKKIDYIVFQTENARDFYGDCIKENSRVIPNPAFSRCNTEEEIISKREPYLFAAGRFQKRKGFDLLVKAFGRICDKFPNYKLFIYGEGEEENLINSLIEEQNLKGRVIIKKPENGVVEKNRKATLFVIPSRSEGIPNILIEAMMEGIPSVATDCSPGGARMLSDNGKYCLLADNDNENSLADKLAFALSNIPEMEIMAQNAKFSLERFDPEKISEMWMRVVDMILDLN